MIALMFLSVTYLPSEYFYSLQYTLPTTTCYIELSFILNLGILAVATNHVKQSGGSQAAVAYSSVGIAFLSFVGIITYHIHMRIKSKVRHIQHDHY